MAKKVMMSTEGVEVFREQTAPKFEIKDGDKLVGQLTVSVGGVRWSPSRSQGDAYYLNWEEFDALMKQQKRG
ncbi:MAG: hypothetical protein NW206_16920 [Hyphomonadaceae bacterium]|nr:hypothetical protein [Hyphomonadaceae bacterium]